MRGRLALAGVVDSRVSPARWLDMAYAIFTEAPHQVLEELNKRIVMETSRLRPDRETWGLLPEQVALSSKLTGDANRRGRGPTAPKKTR